MSPEHGRPISTYGRSSGFVSKRGTEILLDPEDVYDYLSARPSPSGHLLQAMAMTWPRPRCRPSSPGTLSDDAEHEHHARLPWLGRLQPGSAGIGSMRLDGAASLRGHEVPTFITVDDRFVIPQTKRGARNADSLERQAARSAALAASHRSFLICVLTRATWAGGLRLDHGRRAVVRSGPGECQGCRECALARGRSRPAKYPSPDEAADAEA